MGLIKVRLELQIAHFVARLEFAVVFRLFLNSVVGKMNELILQVVYVELPAGRAQVSLLVEVSLVVAVDARHHRVGADVELTAVYQQWIMDVLLHYARPLFGARALRYYIFDLMEILSNLNSLAPVSVLTGLYNPDVRRRLFYLAIIVGLKLVEFRIVQPFFNVESNRKSIERVLADGLVVVLHVDPKGLFVREMVVVLDFVVQPVWVHFQLNKRFHVGNFFYRL